MMSVALRWRRLMLAWWVLTASCLVSGCARKAERAEVRVGYIPFNNCLQFFVALEKGYFAKRGLDVRPVKCNDSTEALNSLLAGKVDALAGITFSSYFAAEQEGAGRFRLFLPHKETEREPFSYLLVRKDSPISSVGQLRGKKIGTYTGVSQLLYLKLFLKKAGFDPDKDVTVIQVASNLQAQALAARQFDALFTVEPYGTIAVEKGLARVLVASPRTKYIASPFWGGAAAVSSRFLGDHKETVRALYEGMAEGVDFIRAHTQEAKSLLPRYTPLEPEVARKSGLYEWSRIDESVDVDAIQQLADMMTRGGVLRKHVSVRPMLLTPDEIR